MVGRARIGVAVLVVAVMPACGGGSTVSAPRTTTTTSTVAPTTTTITTTTIPRAPTTATPSGPPTGPVPPSTVPATTPSPPFGIAVLIHRGTQSRRVVALTFDAGSDVGHTEVILDTLRAAGIHATFSLTGQWTAANPDVARRVVAEGHQIMNHTQDHRSFTGASTGEPALLTAQRIAELHQANATIVAVTGTDARPWFRPPYGDTDLSVQRDAASAGYGYEVMWTLDSLGWNGLPADQITTRVLGAAQPGAIFLFHVGSASQDAAALPGIIDGLRARGYAFETVAQIIVG